MLYADCTHISYFQNITNLYIYAACRPQHVHIQAVNQWTPFSYLSERAPHGCTLPSMWPWWKTSVSHMFLLKQTHGLGEKWTSKITLNYNKSCDMDWKTSGEISPEKHPNISCESQILTQPPTTSGLKGTWLGIFSRCVKRVATSSVSYPTLLGVVSFKVYR